MKIREPAPFKDGGKHKWPVADVNLFEDQVLVDNNLIKRAGVKIDLNAEQRLEVMKCRIDPMYFIRTYCRIITLDHGLMPFNLYEFQEDMIRLYIENRWSVVCTARQMGKTTTVAAFLLWMLLFNEENRWAVLANKADQALEIMDRFRKMYEELPYFLQIGVHKFNLGRVKLENGSEVFSGSSNPDTVRGKSLSGVYWDEAAFTARDEEFWTSTFPVLSSGETTKIILTSTPKGARGVFYKIWEGAKDPTSEKWNEFMRLGVPWNKHPNRNEAWKVSTISKTSPSQFSQEHELAFLGSSGTLIPSGVLSGMQFDNPINNDEFLKIYESPVPGRRYVAIADPSEGVGQDFSVCSVIDITTIPYKLVAKYRSNHISPLLFPYTIITMAENYNNCPLLIESNNDVGGQVSYICYYELEYPEVIMTSTDDKGMAARVGGNASKPGVKTTKKVKAIGCANLKAMIENGKLIIPDDDTIQELGTFVAKGNSFEADEGCHDDCVMPLVLFGWLVKSSWFSEMSESDIQASIYESNLAKMKEELLPIWGTHNEPVTEVYQHNLMGIPVHDGTKSGVSLEKWFSA